MPRNPLGRPNGVKEITVLSCKNASRLESQLQDRRLTLREKIGLRLHLWICNNCREFSRQLQLIRQACQGIEKSKRMHGDTEALSPQAKTRILRELTPKPGDKR